MCRWIRIALKQTKRSKHPHHAMAAVVVKGGSLVSAAANLHRWSRHAELRALRPHMDLHGATLYVVRSNGLASKPCAACMKAIQRSGISEVVYFDREGEVRKMKIDNTITPDAVRIDKMYEMFCQYTV